MHDLIRYAAAPIALGAAAAIALSACNSAADQPVSVHHISVSASQKAQAERNAKTLARCLPRSAVAQIELARTLGTHAGREALIAKCGVPPAKRSAAEATALAAAERGHLTTKAGRVTYFEVTLPQIIEENQV